MPLYEFECSCGQKFEARKSYQDGKFAVCPLCGALAERVMSVCNAAFGWRPTERAHEKGNNPYEYERDI